MTDVHTYRTELAWSGSTGEGYRGYSRAHQVTAPPAIGSLDLTSDPSFRGDPDVMNPEQLLVAAASSCQLLSFLAVAAKARLDVVAYTDVATAVMPTDVEPWHITRVELASHITLADTGAERLDDAALDALVQDAHHGCFIANSLRGEVVATATFEWLLRSTP